MGSNRQTPDQDAAENPASPRVENPCWIIRQPEKGSSRRKYAAKSCSGSTRGNMTRSENIAKALLYILFDHSLDQAEQTQHDLIISQTSANHLPEQNLVVLQNLPFALLVSRFDLQHYGFVHRRRQDAP